MGRQADRQGKAGDGLDELARNKYLLRAENTV
jgi:hypothetical protein